MLPSPPTDPVSQALIGPTTNFIWMRSQACRLETGADEKDYLVAGGPCEAYEPLKAEPNLWLKFSRLAEFPIVGSYEPLYKFVLNYGIPTEEASAAVGPISPSDLVRERRLKVDDFLAEAGSILTTARLLAAIAMAERDNAWNALRQWLPENEGVSRKERLFRSKTALAVKINTELGVPDPTNKGAGGRVLVVAGWDPISEQLTTNLWPTGLKTAMWVQVLGAATGQQLIRDQCTGCGYPFVVRDKRQEYCDRDCRDSANQRAYYRRQKEKSSS